jgi:4-diphosphocytidyl-2-C-methyl-D-erythritol kinase
VRLATLAPGKVNLCLFVGRPRADGLHPLVSIVQPVSLADEVILEPAERDEIVCPGVEGPNLAARALALFREHTGWDEPVRITIRKYVPVAAGMGGGSSDAGATLRLAATAAGLPLPRELAPRLGSDVAALLESGPTLVTGAGERVEPLAPEPLSLVILRSEHELSTAAVYHEADRLGVREDPQLPRRRSAPAPGRPSTTSRPPLARSAPRSTPRSRRFVPWAPTTRWCRGRALRCSACSATSSRRGPPRPATRAP